MALTLVSDPHVRSYELTYLVTPETSEVDLQALKDDFSALAKKYHGEVKTVEDWGRKEMAYAIKHNGKMQREAHYVHTVIEMEAAYVPKFDRDIQLETRVIRHLLVIAE